MEATRPAETHRSPTLTELGLIELGLTELGQYLFGSVVLAAEISFESSECFPIRRPTLDEAGLDEPPVSNVPSAPWSS